MRTLSDASFQMNQERKADIASLTTVISEEDALREENRKQTFQKEQNDWQASLDAQFEFFDAEVEGIKKREEEKTAATEKGKAKRKEIMLAEFNLASTITSSLSTIAQNALGNSKKNAKLRKTIALSEAAINIALGVSKALASSTPPLNFINAAAVGAAGAAQISTIASQKFAQGGIVQGGSTIGDKQNIRVNSGELILNKAQQDNVAQQLTNNITVSPQIIIQGNADQSTVEKLTGSLEELADRIRSTIRNGNLDLKDELGFVT